MINKLAEISTIVILLKILPQKTIPMRVSMVPFMRQVALENIIMVGVAKLPSKLN